MTHTRPISKPVYLTAMIVLSVAAMVSLLVMLGLRRRDEILAVLLIVVLIGIASAIVGLRIWYLAWNSIQDGHARTTPGKAIGFLFIPIFNIYWMFQFTVGFASDFNAFKKRHHIKTDDLPVGFFIAMVILQLITFVLSRIPAKEIMPVFMILLAIEAVLGIVLLNLIINAVNAVAEHRQTGELGEAAIDGNISGIAPKAAPNIDWVLLLVTLSVSITALMWIISGAMGLGIGFRRGFSYLSMVSNWVPIILLGFFCKGKIARGFAVSMPSIAFLVIILARFGVFI